MGGKLEYCGVEILPNGKDIEYIVISHIEFKETAKIRGTEQENMWICHFAKNPYTKIPMLLNSTNRKRLSKQAGTPYLEDVKNFAVRLTQEKARDVHEGGETMGLRISKTPAKKPAASAPRPAPARESLSPEHLNWQKCVDWVAAGKPIDDLRSKYDITPEIETLLSSCLKDQNPGGEKPE